MHATLLVAAFLCINVVSADLDPDDKKYLDSVFNKIPLDPVVYCFYGVEGVLNKDEQTYLSSIFSKIPVEQRKYVLLHQLYLGYIKENPHVTPIDYEIAPEDTDKIYNIFLQKLKVPDNKPKLKGQICFPNGSCINTDDSGIYPI